MIEKILAWLGIVDTAKMYLYAGLLLVAMIFGFWLGTFRASRKAYSQGYHVGYLEGAAGKRKKIWPHIWRLSLEDGYEFAEESLPIETEIEK